MVGADLVKGIGALHHLAHFIAIGNNDLLTYSNIGVIGFIQHLDPEEKFFTTSKCCFRNDLVDSKLYLNRQVLGIIVVDEVGIMVAVLQNGAGLRAAGKLVASGNIDFRNGVVGTLRDVQNGNGLIILQLDGDHTLCVSNQLAICQRLQILRRVGGIYVKALVGKIHA